MRQQEANQFDKGLCLDNNALAIDNHTLTGALNATMITMNGNELVLQNDMGNAKVDRANLQEGYIPVGIKEFGGIVYVASYNPSKGTSELGCFPSPERYIESDTGNSAAATITITADNQIARVKLLDIIRPGDSIRIVDNTTFDSKNIERSVLVVDPQSNESFDASDSIHIYSNSSGSLDIYTGNISGELWIQEKLIVPAYIKVSIYAVKSGTYNEITFTPKAYNSDGTEFSNSLSYKLKINGNDCADLTCTAGDDAELKYEITPSLEKYGALKNLTSTGVIQVSQLGTGNVLFGNFRYYNNIITNEFNLEYDISAYVDNENTQVDSVSLKYQEVISNGTSVTLGEEKTIALSTTDYFGNYVNLITYDANTFEKGKIYIAKIVVSTSKIGGAATIYSSDAYTIITSAVTNSYYMNNPEAPMFPTSGDNIPEIVLDWSVDWETSRIEQSSKQINPAAINTGSALPTIKPTDEKIKLQTVQYGRYKRSYTPTINVDTVDDFFPLDVTSSFELTVTNDKYKTETIETSGNLEDSSILTSIAETEIAKTALKENEVTGITNSVWTNSESYIDEGKITLDLGYALTSQYISKLAVNGITGGTDQYAQTFESSDCIALVPYLSLCTQDAYQMESILGVDYYSQDDTTNFTNLKPNSWWSYLTWKGSKNNRERKIVICSADEDYDADYMANKMGEVKGVDDESNPQAIALFQTSSTNATWKFYSSVTNTYLHDKLKVYPALALWQGCSDVAATMHIGKRTTKAYSMPIMYDSNGEMYVIGQYTTTIGTKNGSYSKNMLYNIVENFSKIYIRQEGQTVKYNYYKASEDYDDYKYTLPFTTNVNVAITAKSTATLKLEDAEYPTSVGTYKLPKFSLSAAAKDGSDKYNIDIDLASYDQVADNISYQTAVPTVSNAALIRKSNGSQEVQTYAYTSDDTKTAAVEALDLSQVYYYNSTSNRLINCAKCLISNPETTLGANIANAFHNNLFRVVYDSNIEKYIVVVNKATISSKLIRNCELNIGTNGKYSTIASAAEKHLLNIPILTNSQATKIT